MESHWCVSVNNTNLDPRKYYVPGIASALGIAALTLVCLTCILVDIVNGFRRRKPWLPCKFFALNSITLSLISLAARYPTDRTTLMLSAEEQLCKLSGTVLVCISMGFFMPSLASEKGPESMKNMASLTILVVSVEFNVMAQMFTGVIFSFIFEHAVVLFFMFVLLLMLWTICLEASHGKGGFNEYKRTHFGSKIEFKTTDDMLCHLEWFYIFGYTSNPQFLLGVVTHCATIGLMCTLCALSLLVASLGALVFTELKYCDRHYRSGWTMQMVLMIQILTILVGMFGIGFRWFNMVRHFKPDKKLDKEKWFYQSVYENLYSSPWILTGTIYFNVFRLVEALLTLTLIKMAKAFELVTDFVLKVSMWLLFHFGKERNPKPNSTREECFRNAIHSRGHKVFLDWILKTSVQDMDRLIHKYRTNNPPRDLIQLLLRQPQVPESVSHIVQILGLASMDKDSNSYWSEFRVSCLSMVILVRLVDVVIPSCGSSLKGALHECFDIVYLIDKCLHGESYLDEKRFMLAEDLWMCTNFRCHWFYKKIIEPALSEYKKESGHVAPLAAAVQILKALMKTSETEKLRGFDFYVMAKLFSIREYDSLDDLYEYAEQIFVDMFYLFLGKLPNVIETHLLKSNVEECGENARIAMKLVCKVQQLEDRIGYLLFDRSGVNLERRSDRTSAVSSSGIDHNQTV